ncbi:MAG: hypothetical protein V4596_00410 [Bdellovibrionota bacterium]
MKKILIIFLVVVILGSSGWYWYEFIFSFKEFERLGEIQFPKGTRVLEWHNDGLRTQGKFKIPKNEVRGFVAAYKLTDGGYVGSEFMIAGSCIHHGSNSVQMRLSKDSHILEVEILSPGITDGDIKICSPD